MAGRIGQIGGMTAADASTMLILLWSVVGLLACVLVMGVVVVRRLARIERRLDAGTDGRAVALEADESAEIHPGGAFEQFLSEDPSRRELPKREQFAAYRQWRHERGMNGSNH